MIWTCSVFQTFFFLLSNASVVVSMNNEHICLSGLLRNSKMTLTGDKTFWIKLNNK